MWKSVIEENPRSSPRGFFFLHLGKADHAAMLFVPEVEEEAAEGGAEGEGRDRLEGRDIVIAGGKVVVGDAGFEVVDVMEPDVAADPLEDRR